MNKIAILLILSVLLLSFNVYAAPAEVNIYKCGGTSEKKIALTFDDGPHPKYTAQILERLERYGIKATFFVIGENIGYYGDEIIGSVISAGHELGNHTYSHKHTKKMKDSEFYEDVRKCHDLVKEKYGYEMKLFRPPEGYVDAKVKSIAGELGYSVILWSIDTKDWEHTGSSVITANVKLNASCGDIILMHDYVSKPNTTIAALDEIIPLLLERGYEFVTVSELIKSS